MGISFGRRFLVALLVALIAALIFQVSFFQENSEAYLFPSIIAACMLVMGIISLVREAFDLCVDDFQVFPFQRQWPVIVMMVAALFLVEWIGMYSTAFLTLSAVSYWYSSKPNQRQRIINSLLFAAGFSAFMFLLFSTMLNVQLPRGVFI
jgi:hypothetical protein